MRFLLLLLFAASANAQNLGTTKCLPAMDDTSLTASPAYTSWNLTGVCVRWYCYLPEFTPEYPSGIQKVTYCGTWAIQNLVGGRVQTIQKAADPLKSLNDAGKRFTIVPMTDPSMLWMPQ